MSAKKPLSYKGYLHIDHLLGLQKLISKPRQQDEVLFIIAHQTYELWFKLMLNELESAISHMLAGDVPEATRLIRRVVEVQKVLIQQITVLETIRPKDFLKFRTLLRPASGFQSLQFRELEFVSGQKDEKFLKMHEDDESDYEQLLKRFESPSLWDGFREVLERYKFDINADSKRKLYKKELKALVRLFSGKKYPEVEELAEVLMEYDKNFWLWRTHHIAMVERVIGRKQGTGSEIVKDVVGPYAFNISGVSYLQTSLTKRFFPVLWEARTEISEA
ncbi:MAG: tryptophan 2,3-dioxygenase [Thaumarchaeota archaeon]|nr:tryptophan 2,3-dioxygenase [Nitrososphaerota archaeon]